MHTIKSRAHITFSLLLFLLSSLVYAQTSRKDIETDRALELVQINAKEAMDLATNQGITPYDFGIMLSNQGENNKALAWFSNLVKQTNDPKFFFGKAWVHYRRGEQTQALKDALFLLENDPNAPDLIRARTHYLVASIHREQWDFKAAKTALENSISLYEKLGKHGGLYIAHLERARIAVLENDRAAAWKAIEAAEKHHALSPKPDTIAYIYQIKKTLYFHEAKYQEALKYAQKTEALFLEANKLEYAYWARVDQALLHALLGNFGTAYDMAKTIDEFVLSHNSVKMSHYNNATWILLFRCRDYSYADMRHAMELWAKDRQEGKELLELLSFVESVDCQSIKKVDQERK